MLCQVTLTCETKSITRAKAILSCAKVCFMQKSQDGGWDTLKPVWCNLCCIKERRRREEKKEHFSFLYCFFCVPNLKAERWINITADQISKSNTPQTIDDFVVSLLLVSFPFPQRQSTFNDIFLLSRINIHIFILDTAGPKPCCCSSCIVTLAAYSLEKQDCLTLRAAIRSLCQGDGSWHFLESSTTHLRKGGLP